MSIEPITAFFGLWDMIKGMEDGKKAAQKLVIEGLGHKRVLSGEISVCGAKNSALKAFAATLLFKEKVRIENVPHIEDIFQMEHILKDIGVLINQEKDAYVLDTTSQISSELPRALSKRLRASIVLTGPLLGRNGSVTFHHPGGCLIGARPIDVFLEGFRALGANVSMKGEAYVLTVPTGGLPGGEFFFHTQSVTGTETLMMAAVLGRGKSVLKNAALEPEIVVLADFLNACGARIRGAGTPTIEVEGVPGLHARGNLFETPPDRIEAGSFLILAALTASDIMIRDCEPRHLESLIYLLKIMGVSLEVGGDFIRVRGGDGRYKAHDIKTHEYPGFPTDLQAPMAVFLTQCEGEAFIFETIFEGRFRYVDDLLRMGAHLRSLDQHRIMIKGPTTLSGKELESPDLRAGLAYIIAALVAEGVSVIHNVYNIDRGYEHIEERLSAVGARIKRVPE